MKGDVCLGSSVAAGVERPRRRGGRNGPRSGGRGRTRRRRRRATARAWATSRLRSIRPVADRRAAARPLRGCVFSVQRGAQSRAPRGRRTGLEAHRRCGTPPSGCVAAAELERLIAREKHALRAKRLRAVRLAFGDIDALKQAITPETAAIMLEPTQMEGGVRVFPPPLLPGPPLEARSAAPPALLGSFNSLPGFGGAAGALPEVLALRATNLALAVLRQLAGAPPRQRLDPGADHVAAGRQAEAGAAGGGHAALLAAPAPTLARTIAAATGGHTLLPIIRTCAVRLSGLPSICGSST